MTKPDCRVCEACARFRCFRKARWVAENADGAPLFLCSKHARGDLSVVSKEEWRETQIKAERVRLALLRTALERKGPQPSPFMLVQVKELMKRGPSSP